MKRLFPFLMEKETIKDQSLSMLKKKKSFWLPFCLESFVKCPYIIEHLIEHNRQ